MAPRNNRAKVFAELDEQPVKDYDPEGEISQDDGGSDSESQDSVDENAGTEHYVSVGKSKLRQKVAPALGPQYRGAKVSRAALQESSDEDEDEEDNEEESDSEEFADPDKFDLEADQDDEDAEIESDNALTKSDTERFKDFVFRGSSKPSVKAKKRRPVAADFLSSSEGEESDEDMDDGLDGLVDDLGASDDDEESEGLSGGDESVEDEDEVEEDDDDDDDEEDDDDDEESDDDESEDDNDVDGDAQREELKKIMSEGQKSIVATISQAAKADAEKGKAVRQQRRAFDALLNIRIRLQKALVAANSLEATEDASTEQKEPYEAAEEAAIKLLDSIDGYRRSILPENAKAKIGQKRKRGLEIDMTTQAIWDSMEETETLALAHRRKVLDKWSSKVRNTTAMTSSRKLGPATSQSLVSILDDQMLSSDRLIKRTRTPRSCAPIQASKKVDEDVNIYDDADFYQLLLKELVDQRTLDSTSTTTDGAGITVRWAALKEAKTRKQSTGRLARAGSSDSQCTRSCKTSWLLRTAGAGSRTPLIASSAPCSVRRWS